MGTWALLTKEIDGVNQIVEGAANVVALDNYTGVIITEEIYARQAHKLELIDGDRQFKIKDGMTLLNLEELNDVGLIPQTNDPVINMPVEEE